MHISIASLHSVAFLTLLASDFSAWAIKLVVFSSVLTEFSVFNITQYYVYWIEKIFEGSEERYLDK